MRNYTPLGAQNKRLKELLMVAHGYITDPVLRHAIEMEVQNKSRYGRPRKFDLTEQITKDGA